MRPPILLIPTALVMVSLVVASTLLLYAQPATAGTGAIPGAPTATPPVPGVRQQPDGNIRNIVPYIPAANLWICEQGPCSGAAEGALRVVLRASGVTQGLGAYEFSVQFDRSVIESVNPCDLVFGAGGAGAARGPVEQLESSGINPDCGPPAAISNGTCALSLVLEGLVHFGCATSGQTTGSTGMFPLASLLLVPHPDVKNEVYPVANNGLLTFVNVASCELVDTLGHAVPGSVYGGLARYCRDLAVTVRMLEGDFDLDCDVDATDAQMMTSKYGGFFGGMLYDKRFDVEPAARDLDIDIKDVQKVYGRQDSTCRFPIPAQPPMGPASPFRD